MCPYATASINGVLGRKNKTKQSSHSYKTGYYLSLLTYTEKSGSSAFLATPTHEPISFPHTHIWHPSEDLQYEITEMFNNQLLGLK